MNRFQRRSGCDFSCDCCSSDTTDSDGHWSRRQGGNLAMVTRERKVLANVSIRLNKPVQGAVTRTTLLQIVITLTKRAGWSFGTCVSIFWKSSVQGQGWSEGQGKWEKCELLSRLVGIEVWVDTFRRNPKKKVHAVEESTIASQVGSQDTINAVKANPLTSRSIHEVSFL